jgi:peptidoglycan/xylan/chitin deacetylase (PgdA/CDA1 family)
MVAKRLITLVISLAYAAVREIGRTTLPRVLGRPLSSRLIVLTYHAVPEADAARFESQMRRLKALATPVFADDALYGHGARAAVTFDDGFQSVFEQALPIMARLGIPATLFVPSGYLDAAPGWIPPAWRQAGSSGVVASASTLAAADRSLVRIGSHTVTHPYLATLRGPALHTELALSKQALENVTGAPVTLLSFPYGSYDAGALAAARAAGYARMFANVPVRGGRDGSLAGRVSTSPRDWRLEFQLKVRGAYDWMALAVPAKRAVVGWFARECRA